MQKYKHPCDQNRMANIPDIDNSVGRKECSVLPLTTIQPSGIAQKGDAIGDLPSDYCVPEFDRLCM